MGRTLGYVVGGYTSRRSRTVDLLGAPDFHGFFTWVMDAFSELNEFVRNVVQGRSASRIQAWTNWIR